MSESERTERENIAIDAARLFYMRTSGRLGVPTSGLLFEPVDVGAIAIVAALILIDAWQGDRLDRTNELLASIRDYGIDQERDGRR